MLPDDVERLVGDRRVRVDRRLEGGEPGRRLDRGLAGVDEAHAVVRAPEVRRHRHRRGPAGAIEHARDRPGVPEVVRHQRFHALPRRLAGIVELAGELLLQLVPEHVVVAAAFEVHERPDAQQEVLGQRQQRQVFAAAPQQRGIGHGRDGARRRDVAQAARRVLHVRLELIQRRVELRVPGVDQLLQRAEHVRVRPRHVERLPQPLEQRGVAGHQPRVGQREQELGIVHVQLRELGDVTDLVADDEAGVPQGMQQAPQEPFFRLLDRAVEQHEQVDVGERTEMPPAVSADGDERGGPARRPGLRVEPPQPAVHVRGIPRERGHAALAGEDVPADGPARLFQQRRGRRGFSPSVVTRLPYIEFDHAGCQRC